MPESLLCNSCGAPLDVPDSANFVKCNHCKTTLKIRREHGATTTEAIEKLAETTEGLAQQVEKLARQNELASLDREWETQRRSFMVRDKQGNENPPAAGVALLMGGSAVFFGLIWTVLAFSITRAAPDYGPFRIAKFVFPLFGLGFIAFGIFLSIGIHGKAKAYEQAEREYRERRSRMGSDED